MSDPSVVIIILTYNSAPHIRECFASLAGLDYPNFEIVVVDNASTDETVSLARTSVPAPTVLVNDTNLGFAAGNNVGLRYALSTKADYALILNDDVLVARDVLRALVNVAQAEPQSALLGPQVYHHAAPTVIQSAGGGRTSDWQFFHRGQNQVDYGQFTQVDRVVWLTGCAMLARCAALPQIGLFDPDYFMYWEDVDWCLRARAKGYEVLFVPAAKVWHKGVQIDYQPNPQVVYYSVRNEFLLFRKHHAGVSVTLRAFLRHARTVTSYTLRPKWRARHQHRDALVRGVYDALRRQVGPATWR
jgi:hypothetical protein